MAKKKNTTLGRGKPLAVEIHTEIVPGAIIIDSVDSARESLEMMEQAKADIAPVLDFIERTRKAATDYQVTHAVDVVQCDGFYYRKVQRFSRFWVGTDSDMPKPKPKGAKSLKSIVEGIVVKRKGKKDMPLWNFITKRVVDPDKIDEAVRKGYIKQSEINKAFLEAPQSTFIQRYQGVVEDG